MTIVALLTPSHDMSKQSYSCGVILGVQNSNLLFPKLHIITSHC